MPQNRPANDRRDDSDARRAVRILTWLALIAAALGVLLVAFPALLPFGGPWVQLVLGALTLVFAFRARSIGIHGVKDYDGRLSLLAALAGFVVVFFAGNAAFGVLATLGS